MEMLDGVRLEKIRALYRIIDGRAITNRKFDALVKVAIEEGDTGSFHQEVKKLVKNSIFPFWLALSLDRLLWDREIRKQHGGLLIGDPATERQRVLDMCDTYLERASVLLWEHRWKKKAAGNKIVKAHSKVKELRESLPEAIGDYLKENKTETFDRFLLANPEYNIPQISKSDTYRELFVDIHYRQTKNAS